MRERATPSSKLRHAFALLLVFFALRTASLAVAAETAPNSGSEAEEYGELGLLELGRIKVTRATLTETSPRRIPAAVTVIDQDNIEQSGARSINEALDIFVPNTQIMLHHFHLDHVGIRGTISDRDDKYLLRVNNKVMNQRMFVGANNERGTPLLGDLREITVIRGPASATYGAGALAGVINLETHSGLTFQGSDFNVRQGVLDEFTSAQWRYGRKLDADTGIFAYYGSALRNGANQDRSPYVFGSSFPAAGGSEIVAGEEVEADVPNLHSSGYGRPDQKAYASYVSGPLETWVRFTQDGLSTRPDRSAIGQPPYGLATETDDLSSYQGFASLNRQLSTFAGYTLPINDSLELKAEAGYDFYKHVWERRPPPLPRLYRREDEFYARLLTHVDEFHGHSIAVGLENSYEIFNGPTSNTPVVEDSWDTNTISPMLEDQWRLCPGLSTFLSGRLDKHSYSEWLFSPRAAAVLTPTELDTLKLIWGKAVRRNGDGELRREFREMGSKGDDETQWSSEVRYERGTRDGVTGALSAFYSSNEAIGFNSAINRSVQLGDFDIWGVEPELSWKSDRSRLSLSHGYSKLVRANLADSSTIQGISAEPYGFGDDLANWSNHITKLALSHDVNSRWSASTSLRVYWGFPGAEDLANYNASRETPAPAIALDDGDYDKAYGENIYWNAGLSYKATDKLTLHIDAYNMLGWLDEDLNKRNYINRGSEYSVEAAAFAFGIRWSF